MSKKPNIILDLDQTLISAESFDEYDEEKNKDKAKLFSHEKMENYYIVFERPGLQPFLDYIFKHFNVSIWTAASKDYALFIIEKIIIKGKSNRKLDWIFFSHHCKLSDSLTGETKSLRLLWDVYKLNGYEKHNTIILDDYDKIHDVQKGNCILAKPFEFTHEDSDKDTFLKELTDKLSKSLDELSKSKNDNPTEIINKN
jgi:hypothetical protein